MQGCTDKEQCNLTVPIVDEGYIEVAWLVEWGLADHFDKVNIVCRNQTHTE
jgi:hypothetical protein